jgi:hypothetical protein
MSDFGPENEGQKALADATLVVPNGVTHRL